MTAPNFSGVHPGLIDQAHRAFEKKDGCGFMDVVGHAERGMLLLDNMRALLDAGMYEDALELTFTHGPTFTPEVWRFLFLHADRSRLLNCGDPLPTETITVYRGINDCRRRKWIRGLSWTTNPHTAAWFAERYPIPGRSPAVYALEVKPENILLMTNGRSEEEVVVAVWNCGKIKRVSPMPESRKPGGAK